MELLRSHQTSYARDATSSPVRGRWHGMATLGCATSLMLTLAMSGWLGPSFTPSFVSKLSVHVTAPKVAHFEVPNARIVKGIRGPSYRPLKSTAVSANKATHSNLKYEPNDGLELQRPYSSTLRTVRSAVWKPTDAEPEELPPNASTTSALGLPWVSWCVLSMLVLAAIWLAKWLQVPRPRSDVECGAHYDYEERSNFAMLAIEGKEQDERESFQQRISMHARKGDVDSVLKAFQEMVKRNFNPDVQTYSMVIHAHARNGDADGAMQWFNTMKEDGTPPNVVTYGSIINACARSGKVEAAVGCFRAMEQDGIIPDVICYGSVINACARGGKADQAIQWLDTMIQQGLSPNTVVYSSVIKACARNGDAASAGQWLQRMLDQGVKPEAVSYNTVIEACAKEGDIAAATEWLDAMRETGIEPSARTLSTVLNVCTKASDPTRAIAMLELMENRGLKPDVVTYTSIINACARIKPADMTGALQMARKMRDNKVGMNEYTLQGLLKCCANAQPCEAEKAEKLFVGLIPRLELNAYIEKALRSAVSKKKADRLIQWAREQK